MSTSSAGSGTSSYCSEPSFGMYPKAPGSERSERSSSKEEEHQVCSASLFSWLVTPTYI